jgi:hypothetical protein
VFVCMCVYIKNMGSWAHMSSVQCVCTHVYVCACVCVCGVCVCAQHVTTQASSHDKETNNDATATDEVRLAVWLLSSSQRRKTPTSLSRERATVQCTLYTVPCTTVRGCLVCGLLRTATHPDLWHRPASCRGLFGTGGEL